MNAAELVAGLGAKLGVSLKLGEAGTCRGGACIGLDAAREIFTLHVILRGDIPYEFFEAELTRFLKALRYWKEWLALPAASASPAQEGDAVSSYTAGMIRV